MLPRVWVRFLFLAIVSAAAAGRVRADSLDDRLDALLAQPQIVKATVSLDIVELTPRGSVPLYSRNPTLPLMPASNCKLLTTAAAFERYGADAKFRTELFRAG